MTIGIFENQTIDLRAAQVGSSRLRIAGVYAQYLGQRHSSNATIFLEGPALAGNTVEIVPEADGTSSEESVLLSLTIENPDSAGVDVTIEQTDSGESFDVVLKSHHIEAGGRLSYSARNGWTSTQDGTSTARQAIAWGLSAAQTTNIAAGDHLKFDQINEATAEAAGLAVMDTSSSYSTSTGADSIGRWEAIRTAVVQVHAFLEPSSAGVYQASFEVYDTTSGSVVAETIGKCLASPNTLDAIYRQTAGHKYELRMTSLAGAALTNFAGTFRLALIEV